MDKYSVGSKVITGYRKISSTLLVMIMVFFSFSNMLYGQMNFVLRTVEAPNEEKSFFVASPLNANVLYNITQPSLVWFAPKKANGCGVIVLPGGGFSVLNFETEGKRIADSLTARGITAFIFKYGLIRSTSDNPWTELLKNMRSRDTSYINSSNQIIKVAGADLQLALKFIRKNAAQFSVDTNRLGIMGFSAGAALAADMAYNFREDNRPDFVAPIYGTYHSIRQKKVKNNAPPIFIAAATDDSLASVLNSVELYTNWVNAGRSAQLHTYAVGGHGLKGQLAAGWLARFVEWLYALKFLN